MKFPIPLLLLTLLSLSESRMSLFRGAFLGVDQAQSPLGFSSNTQEVPVTSNDTNKTVSDIPHSSNIPSTSTIPTPEDILQFIPNQNQNTTQNITLHAEVHSNNAGQEEEASKETEKDEYYIDYKVFEDVDEDEWELFLDTTDLDENPALTEPQGTRNTNSS
jgi:hypothetical protein